MAVVSLPVPLLAFPHLSTSAKVLSPHDVEVQYTLAKDTYCAMQRSPRADRWGPVVMWAGCTGALLFWWGCLAAQRPAGVVESPAYIEAWLGAYRAGEMAVGPLPWWLGDTGFHLRCQSKLLAGDPAYYGKHFVHAPLELAYWWPKGDGSWQITS